MWPVHQYSHWPYSCKWHWGPVHQYINTCFYTGILFTHIGLLLAGGIGVAVADVLAIALLGRAVLLVCPWTLVILQTYWYSCVFWVGWKFCPFPHLLGNGFPSLSLVRWWSSARIASPPCCTRHNPCWGESWTTIQNAEWHKMTQGELVCQDDWRQTWTILSYPEWPWLMTLTWSGRRSMGSLFLRGCTCSCTLQGSPCQTSCSRTCALGTCGRGFCSNIQSTKDCAKNMVQVKICDQATEDKQLMPTLLGNNNNNNKFLLTQIQIQMKT